MASPGFSLRKTAATGTSRHDQRKMKGAILHIERQLPGALEKLSPERPEILANLITAAEIGGDPEIDEMLKRARQRSKGTAGSRHYRYGRSRKIFLDG